MSIRVVGKGFILMIFTLLVTDQGLEQVMAGKWCMVLDPNAPTPSLTTNYPDANWNWGELEVPPDLPSGVKEWEQWRCRGGGVNKGTFNLGVHPMEIDLSYFQNHVFPNDDCFANPDGEFGGYTGSFGVAKKKNIDPTASFWFWAEDKNGEGKIHYYFKLTRASFVPGPTDGIAADTCAVDNWIPDVGCVTYVQFWDWELKFEGSGKDKKRACQDSGSFYIPGTVAVYRMYE